MMGTLAELEERVAALEREVEELRRKSGAPRSNAEWLQQIADSCKDIPAEALEAMYRYGREFRESQPYPGE
jgi:hypothetical protein